MYTIRAIYNECTVRVYQAYCKEIALPALDAQTFVWPFKKGRMTWIKPSFNWMMYRSGFGLKERQECILAIDIKRQGFEWVLGHSVISGCPESYPMYADWKRVLQNSCVRVQWDPERNWRLDPVENMRSIQLGLKGEAMERYVHDWIQRIDDVTPLAIKALEAIKADRPAGELPPSRERIFPFNLNSNRYLKPIVV